MSNQTEYPTSALVAPLAFKTPENNTRPRLVASFEVQTSRATKATVHLEVTPCVSDAFDPSKTLDSNRAFSSLWPSFEGFVRFSFELRGVDVEGSGYVHNAGDRWSNAKPGEWSPSRGHYNPPAYDMTDPQRAVMVEAFEALCRAINADPVIAAKLEDECENYAQSLARRKLADMREELRKAEAAAERWNEHFATRAWIEKPIRTRLRGTRKGPSEGEPWA